MNTTLKTIAFLAVGIASGIAMAGPNWDAINSARAAARQHAKAQSAATSTGCADTMKKMDAPSTGQGTGAK